MSTKIDLSLVEPGQVWCRAPDVHSMREAFSCCVDHRELPLEGGKQGPWMHMECFALVSGWYDDPCPENAYSRAAEQRARGFTRWYHIVGYGYLHESNLFGFFRRVV